MKKAEWEEAITNSRIIGLVFRVAKNTHVNDTQYRTTTNFAFRFQIYKLSYFLNTVSATTFLGALLPVHSSNWT